MTKFERVCNVLLGLLMLAFAGLLILHPVRFLPLVLIAIGYGMTLRGMQTMLYYFTMARSMVGGKSVLYMGIIYLDLGILSSAIADNPTLYVIGYIAVLNFFNGAVIMMRTQEMRGIGLKHWKLRFTYGLINIITPVAVVISVAVFDSTAIAVYVYAAGLVISGIEHIRSAFLKTSIVYIQ